jgi:DNA-binding NarL/FixJ family response regulator
LGKEKSKRLRWQDEDLLLLELISLGHTNKEIAPRLLVSQSAIKKRVSRLLGILQAPTRVALVRAAFDAGLITPDAAEGGSRRVLNGGRGPQYSREPR